MTPPPSLRESPVRPISSKGNLGNQVCTSHLKLHYLLLWVLYQDLLPHFSLLHQMHHHTHHTNEQQNAETSPESSLPCGQWTPIGSTSTDSTTSQHTPPQSVVPPQPATPQSHTDTHNSRRHHNHLPLHNLSNSLLLGQILIQPPSLPFQLQRHINLWPAHHHSTFLSLQMVKE